MDGGAASFGSGWGAADALLSEEVQHPIRALGVAYLGDTESPGLTGAQ